jgi:hypothetical protein
MKNAAKCQEHETKDCKAPTENIWFDYGSSSRANHDAPKLTLQRGLRVEFIPSAWSDTSHLCQKQDDAADKLSISSKFESNRLFVPGFLTTRQQSHNQKNSSRPMKLPWVSTVNSARLLFFETEVSGHIKSEIITHDPSTQRLGKTRRVIKAQGRKSKSSRNRKTLNELLDLPGKPIIPARRAEPPLHSSARQHDDQILEQILRQTRDEAWRMANRRSLYFISRYRMQVFVKPERPPFFKPSK